METDIDLVKIRLSVAKISLLPGAVSFVSQILSLAFQIDS